MLVSSRPNSAETRSQDELGDRRDRGGGRLYSPHSDCIRAEARIWAGKLDKLLRSLRTRAGDPAPGPPSGATAHPPPAEVAKGPLHPRPRSRRRKEDGADDAGSKMTQCRQH